MNDLEVQYELQKNYFVRNGCIYKKGTTDFSVGQSTVSFSKNKKIWEHPRNGYINKQEIKDPFFCGYDNPRSIMIVCDATELVKYSNDNIFIQTKNGNYSYEDSDIGFYQVKAATITPDFKQLYVIMDQSGWGYNSSGIWTKMKPKNFIYEYTLDHSQESKLRLRYSKKEITVKQDIEYVAMRYLIGFNQLAVLRNDGKKDIISLDEKEVIDFTKALVWDEYAKAKKIISSCEKKNIEDID